MENWIITDDGSECVVHAGILGMKWGRRRYQNKDGSLTPEGRLRYGSKDDGDDNVERKLSSRQMRRRMSDMSDTELQNAINRKQKEKQLREMLDEEISPGKKKANEILSRIGTDVAVSVGTSAAKTGLHYMLTKLAGNNDVAQDLVRSLNISNFGKEKYEWDLDAKKYKRDQDRKAADEKAREEKDREKEASREAKELQREEERYQRDLKRDDARYERDQARRAEEEKAKEARDLAREEEKYKRDLKRDDEKYARDQARKAAEEAAKPKEAPSDNQRTQAIQKEIADMQTSLANARLDRNKYANSASISGQEAYEAAIAKIAEEEAKIREYRKLLTS